MRLNLEKENNVFIDWERRKQAIFWVITFYYPKLYLKLHFVP